MGRFLRTVIGSPWTHAFIVTGTDELVESMPFSGVKIGSLIQRMAELKKEKRRYFVLDSHLTTRNQKLAIAEKAKSYVGLGYNVLSALYWFLFGYFFYDSHKRMICSRIITAAYQDGAQIDLFSPAKLKKLEPIHREDLENGYATPEDLLRRSILIVVDRG